jgi:hypothetical protein
MSIMSIGIFLLIKYMHFKLQIHVGFRSI